MIDVPALALYFAVMSITPGPNNVMVTASGATYGYRATIPHVLGIGMGAALQMILVALGIGLIFEKFPVLHTVLALIGSAYLVYLAWKLSRAGAMAESLHGVAGHAVPGFQPQGLGHGHYHRRSVFASRHTDMAYGSAGRRPVPPYQYSLRQCLGFVR